MLCLQRKPRESICIGPDIRVTVGEISRGKVLLGVEAPRSMPVCRAEAADRWNLRQIEDALDHAESNGKSAPEIAAELLKEWMDWGGDPLHAADLRMRTRALLDGKVVPR